MLHIVKAIVTGLLLLAIAGCNELPTAPADATGMAVRGVTLADWTATGYGSASAAEAIDDIARLGANRLVIVVTAYQERTTDSAVRVDPRKTPGTSAVRAAAAAAASAGMEVAIKLHVDLDDGEWRGNIRPIDVTAWFDSYGSWVRGWALEASGMGAVQLVAGTELAGTIEHGDRWRDLIASVRTRFGGEVVYAASWDEAWMVPFWDAVDRVGVDFYAPVTGRAEAGRVEILAGWQPWIERLNRLRGQTDKAILLTEIGYRSVDGAGMRPWDFSGDAGYDGGEQADLYWAALEAASGAGWIEGVYWWNWLVNGEGGPLDRDYTPKGKPAAGELAGAWNG